MMQRILLSLVIGGALVMTPAASASGALEARELWVQSIIAVRDGVCKDEEKRAVRNKLEYAAVLVAHNELEEMRSILARAAKKAQSTRCLAAIEKSAQPPE